MSREILEAMHALAREKGIEPEKLMIALEDALLSAYKKQPGSAKYARVEMDRETADFRVIELIIPERLEAHLIVETIDEETTVDPETGEMREPEEPEIDPKKFEEYRDQIEEQDVTPDDFGRIAAQTAKQVILQRIREAERDMMFEEYRDRVGELITGIVQQSDSRYTLVQLRERVEALLPKSEQVEGERYDHSQRIKAVIKEVSPSTKGPSIIVSRRDPELIKKLFELEVPEIADGLVEIANVAREPGYRSKIAVVSNTDGVDPVGACVGPRGSRVRMVVSELRGEKIDIIPFNDEPARFVAKALSPARVREVLVDDEAKQATVIVPDDQLSLAIGREGQNARLAARLTGWRVDIRSESEFAAEEAESGYEEEEVQGRCAAILSNGRRCPNASLPNSRYCGLESHQALANIEGDQVADLTPGDGDSSVSGEQPAEAPTAQEPDRRRSPRRGRPSGGAPMKPAEQATDLRQRHRGADAIGPHVPQRRCVGCGHVAAKSELVRLAAAEHRPPPTTDGRVRRAVLDRAGTMPGRGAYLCRGAGAGEPSSDCVELATRRGGLARALRCAVKIDPELLESMRSMKEARTRDRKGARSLQQGIAGEAEGCRCGGQGRGVFGRGGGRAEGARQRSRRQRCVRPHRAGKELDHDGRTAGRARARSKRMPRPRTDQPRRALRRLRPAPAVNTGDASASTATPAAPPANGSAAGSANPRRRRQPPRATPHNRAPRASACAPRATHVRASERPAASGPGGRRRVVIDSQASRRQQGGPG